MAAAAGGAGGAGGAGAGAGASAGIDQNLYSRQLAVFGEAMGKLITMDVLIVGLRGLGVEIAKNLILAGPRSVTLYDPEPVTMLDVGANYYFKPSQVGAPRAASCAPSLSELNPYVRVAEAGGAGPVPDELVARHHVVVLADVDRATALRVNAVCRAAPKHIGCIVTGVAGVAGYAFVDFGDKHVVNDPNGERTKSAAVTSVFAGSPTTVYFEEEKRHGFEVGDHLSFREVGGMEELNGAGPVRVTRVHKNQVTVEVDSTAWGRHTTGGIADQTKVPTTVAFASLAERIVAPVPSDDPAGLITADLGKFGRPEQLHTALAALEAYRARHGHLPPLRDAGAAAEVAALAREVAASWAGKPGALAVEVDDAVVRNVALTACAQLPALCAFFGGVVAQEVVKYTGKFSPLRQWLYLDAFEVYPEGHEALPAAEYAASGNRYDNAVAILGRTLQAKVANQRAFVVGAGALGCELLKSCALMGVGCGPEGRVVVTDMDRIEPSNLNRQFLFRAKDVKHPKSTTAAAAAQAMNPDLKISALEVPVGEDTESTFNDDFWGGVDVVINALDNVKARTYMDGRCIFYGKPLLESGTLGTKANTQVVLPFKTECYSDSVDPPEDSIPMCTLRNFPHAIEHCIEWARDLFAGTFTNPVQEAAAFVASPAKWLSDVAEESNMHTRRTKLAGVAEVLKAAQGATWATCVAAALHIFHANFYTGIKQLLHNFPADYVDPKTDVKFWSPPKRVPVPQEFSAADAGHFAFVVHAAALIAANFNIALPDGYDSHAVTDPLIAAVHLAPFVPKATRIKASDTDTTVEGSDDDATVASALAADLARLAGTLSSGAAYNLTPADFEKDDDTNHHIDFITAASNLRARNYTIRETDRFNVKLIAGRIIPAVATTTCSVTGLVCIEAYKVFAGKPVEAARNTYLNLAINLYSMAEPVGPKRTKSVAMDPITMGPIKAVPEGFTRWDRFVIKGHPDMTPAQLSDWLQANHGARVSMIGMGAKILYNPLLFAAHRAGRTNKPLRAIVEEATGHPVTKAYVVLDISAEDDDGDVVVPPVQVYVA